ncbi:cold-shock protein [Aureibacter tunicatorum]|uniref:Cold shock CspA family protein n=1 Tax=Aureibacter tunicatorum TaxID=866807 RepID=A0AAE3XQ85_9BACT|nr:cold shock domain-containing protein [Aureibacter tunicatorum]MDR6240577.1 cold shock CspA family protein [Aureibacter tunicatorum]BDD06562.1 cold-shock protein [Aureibacter tunicatorum]
MSRSRETFSKKEVRNKKEKKRKEKLEKKQERKEAKQKKSFDDMIVYVDENGNLTSTPPDLTQKKEIKAESIELGVPKREAMEEDDELFIGIVDKFESSKGFGFIREKDQRDSVFVHINECVDRIKQGDKVKFQKEKTPKGIRALQVKLA